MTGAQLKLYFRQKLVSRRTIAQEHDVLDTLVDFITQSVTSGIPAWAYNAVFNVDGTGDGAFCTYPDITGALRFWNSKTNNNANHAPPKNPSETENTYWKEVSPSSGSAIKAYAPGLIGEGLFITYYNNGEPGLYVLKDNVARPFNSTNLLTEFGQGKWQKFGSGGGGGGVSSRLAVFRFNSNLFTEHALSFRGVITSMSASSTAGISAVTYESRLDSSSTWVAHPNLSALQTWINSNITGSESAGVKYWIKSLATITSTGSEENILIYTPTA
jgi:hypothetical protein